MNAHQFANRFSADRSVTVGVLGLRTARYLGEGRQVVEGIEGLTVRSMRSEEVPVYHSTSGIYGFLALPPGPNRIQIQDPAGRYLPRVLELDVANREAERRAMERGMVMVSPGVNQLIETLELRPSIGSPSRGAETIVWGRVVDEEGWPVPFARLEIETQFDGTPGSVVALSDIRGVYLALLSGERSIFNAPPETEEENPLEPPPPGPVVDPLIVEFDRAVQSVHVLEDAVRAALEWREQRGEDPLGALPPAFDSLPPSDPASPYDSHAFELRTAPPASASAPTLRIHVGRRVRFDVHLSLSSG